MYGEIEKIVHKTKLASILYRYIERYGSDWVGDLPTRYNVGETLHWHTKRDPLGVYGTSVEIKISTDGRVTIR